jgi:transcriptional regulator with XRE-family HTH domain
VGKWRRRFIDGRLDGLLDEPRPGGPRRIGDVQIEQVIVKTLESKPRDATHWSTRSMAKATGLSQTTISRIWRAFVLQPHRSETFKLSTDPLFVEKVRDVVGLYLNPPEKALYAPSTRSRRSRRSIARSRSCRCVRVRPSGEPMTMCATEPRRSSQPSTWRADG